jgi:hypothetical protein
MIRKIISICLFILLGIVAHAQDTVQVNGVNVPLTKQQQDNQDYKLYITTYHIYAVFNRHDLYDVPFSKTGIDMENKSMVDLPDYVSERDWRIMQVDDKLPKYIAGQYELGQPPLFIYLEAETGDRVSIVHTTKDWQLRVGG